MKARIHQVLCALLLLTSGVPAAWAQEPVSGDKSADACPGTLAQVRKDCGCEPREEAAFNALSQTMLNDDNLRSQVKHCFNLDGKADIKRLKFNADINGCLSRLEDQYPEYRETLSGLVKAAKDVPPVKLEVWLCCYARKLGQEAQGCKAAGAPPPAPPKKATGSSTKGPSAPAAASGIQQELKAPGGRVKAGDMKASHGGKAGSAHIQQKAEASGNGVIEMGNMEATVSPD
jgi:hypothetical protein